MHTEICKYCHKKVEIKKDGHKGSMQGHLAKCNEYQKYKNEILTKEYLYNEYIVNRHSAKWISEQTGINTKAIIKKLKFFNIDTRTLKESCNEAERKQRYKETCLKNFGYEHNFCKNTESRKKWEQQLFDDYGITNIFQREDIKFKSHISLFHHKGKTQLRKISKVEKKVLDFLISEGYDVINNKKILCNNKVKYADCVINNKIIEVNGDIYHANPKIYKSNDLIRFWGYNDKAKLLWDKDYQKFKEYKHLGYDVLYVWEKDIKENFDKVKDIIKKFIERGENEGFYNKEYKEN